MKQQVWLQFNKISGAYISFMTKCPEEYLEKEHYNWVSETFDIDSDTVIGTFKKYQIKSIKDLPVPVREVDLNNQCKAKINKRFQPEVQLDILRNVITELASKAKLKGDVADKLDDMNSYIDEIKRRNKVLKESYKNGKSFKYVSIEDEIAEEDARMEGGLHEVFGPKNLVESE